MEVIISADVLTKMSNALFDETERGAALYLQHDKAGHRFLVHTYELAVDDDVIAANEFEITFAPQFLTRVTRRARSRGVSLGVLHTHPPGALFFSNTDDHAEQTLAHFMAERSGGLPTFAFVLCEGTLLARVFGTSTVLPVRVVGSNVFVTETKRDLEPLMDKFDRQIRAFGVEGQRLLNQMSIAIVGLGGTGSVLAQQLAHLGLGSFFLIDADTVEETNLNRIVGSTHSSVGVPKVEVSAKLVAAINPGAKVNCLVASVITDEARTLLCQADCIFVCTDSHTSRAFVAELAYQYLIPAIDVGVSISATAGIVSAITGRTQMIGPGMPCLLCCNALNANRIREELMSTEQRAADPYFIGDTVKQPAVISINSTVVSLAVTMFLSAFTGIPAKARWLSYDGISGTVRPLATSPDPDCGVCGVDGVVALGDSRKLTLIPNE